jgi:cell division protein FtsA
VKENVVVALDVGTTKVCALVAEVEEDGTLRVIGAGRVPSKGLHHGVVINAAEATASVGRAIAEAERTSGQTISAACVGIAGSHISSITSKGVVAVGRNGGRSITRDDTERALDQARHIALPHNRELIHTEPRSYTVDDQRGIQDPLGMFGYQLEVEASVITGAVSAVNNLANCVKNSGVAVQELVLEPLASGKATLRDDERELGVAVVDIGGGTTDIAIYMEGTAWHTAVIDVGGDNFVRDVAAGLRMSPSQAEPLIKEYGHVIPARVPSEAEVRSGAFGESGQQSVNRRLLSLVLNARAEELAELILRSIKRSGYDGMMPAGVVLTGGVSQLNGFPELCGQVMQWPIRVGKPQGIASSIMDLSSPEYSTAVGLLQWAAQSNRPRQAAAAPPGTGPFARLQQFFKSLLP